MNTYIYIHIYRERERERDALRGLCGSAASRRRPRRRSAARVYYNMILQYVIVCNVIAYQTILHKLISLM